METSNSSNLVSASPTTFNVGTRKSRLALKQTELVLAEAAKQCPEYSFTVRARDTAAGDIDKVTPFKDMPVKNIWTHELETLMREGGLDFLVHSLKGMFTSLLQDWDGWEWDGGFEGGGLGWG